MSILRAEYVECTIGLQERILIEMTGIRQWFGNGFKSKQEVEADKEEQFAKWNEELRATGKKELRWEDLYDEKDTKKDEAKA